MKNRRWAARRISAGAGKFTNLIVLERKCKRWHLDKTHGQDYTRIYAKLGWLDAFGYNLQSQVPVFFAVFNLSSNHCLSPS